MWLKIQNSFWRVVYLIGLSSFLLTFVTVKSCSYPVTNVEFTDYHGYELITRKGGWLLLFPVGLGALLIALSFLRRHADVTLRGFLQGWQAALSLVAAYLVVTLPAWLFFPDSVTLRVGVFVNSASWIAVYLNNLAGSLRSFIRVRRSPLPPATPPRQSALTAVASYLPLLLAVPDAGILFGPVIGGIGPRWEFDVLTGVSFLVPTGLAMHFYLRGLIELQRWASLWRATTALLVLAGGAIGGLQWIVWKRPDLTILRYLGTLFGAGITGLLYGSVAGSRGLLHTKPKENRNGRIPSSQPKKGRRSSTREILSRTESRCAWRCPAGL